MHAVYYVSCYFPFKVIFYNITLSLILQAETLEDLYEWKTALENALAEAPNAALAMGQNGIFRSDQAGAPDGSLEQCMLQLTKINLKSLSSLTALYNSVARSLY